MCKNSDKKEENESSKKEILEKNIIKHDELGEIKVWPNEWMIKPCDMYNREYKDCKSLRGRFYQHFVYGEKFECQQWKIDYDNCQKWKKYEDEQAYIKLLESEKKHRANRLRPHAENDVWTRRKSPPSDWAEPLPDWMNERLKGSFLEYKQKDITEKGHDHEVDLMIPSACNIL